MPEPVIYKPIRSYVIREGRITPGQARALKTLWPLFGLERIDGQQFDFGMLFGRNAPVVCEIGFGNGDSLCQMAQSRPDWNFLGIEVHRPGIGSLLLQLQQYDITNVRVVHDDAVMVLAQAIPEGSLHRLHLFFPDPWPKKRHHKRRILSASFVDLVISRLVPGQGIFHFASDWEPYAEYAMEILRGSQELCNMHSGGGYGKRPDWRPETRFERRGLSKGHQIYEIQMRRIRSPNGAE